MPEIEEIEALRGSTVVGSDGNKIGKVDEIYLDEESLRPGWALVNTGLFGLKSSFVLITDARADGDQLTVPFDKATVKDAPNIDPEGALSPEEEEVLFAHYGRADYAGTAPAAAEPQAAAAPAAAARRDEDASTTEGAATTDDATVTEDTGPSASLAAARVAHEDRSGLGGGAASSDGPVEDRTMEDLEALRRGPEGETGRSDTEDPVPPDGGPPPRNAHTPGDADPAIGQGSPDATDGGTPADPDPRGDHWEQEALPERGNATATPDSGPVSEPTEQDVLEAPETPDSPGPGGSGVGGRTRLRKYVPDGSSDSAHPGSPKSE